MIRGVFSLVGMGILFVLLVRTVQGEIGLADVAVRGLVIVVAIAVVDKLIVPLVAFGLRSITVSGDADDPSPTGSLAAQDGGN